MSNSQRDQAKKKAAAKGNARGKINAAAKTRSMEKLQAKVNFDPPLGGQVTGYHLEYSPPSTIICQVIVADNTHNVQSLDNTQLTTILQFLNATICFYDVSSGVFTIQKQ